MAKRFAFRFIRERYAAFAEKQGFAIIITVCVAVITGTALWTRQTDAPYVAPTPPNVADVSAARLMQQPLSQATTPAPAPTCTPVVRQWPVQSRTVLRGFDDAHMVVSGITGIYAVHDAVDLSCGVGEAIRSPTDGTVTACGEDGLLGAWVTVSDGGDLAFTCAGMAMLAAVRPGDAVRAGQTLGFGGNGVLHEGDMPPHLHLRVTEKGRAVDPLPLFEQAE